MSLIDFEWWAQLIANLITIFGLPLALASIWFVVRQMRNDKLAVSAGAVGAMRIGIMDRIDRVLNAGSDGDTEAWGEQVRELFNDLELACAIFLDGQLSGRTGVLAESLLRDLLLIIQNDDDLKIELEKAVHAPHTFVNIKDFVERKSNSAPDK